MASSLASWAWFWLRYLLESGWAFSKFGLGTEPAPGTSVLAALPGLRVLPCILGTSARRWLANLGVHVKVWKGRGCDRCFWDLRTQYLNIILY